MRYIRNTARLLPIIALALTATHVSAGSPSSAIRVEFEQPGPVMTGEEATTVITFRAMADFERIDVSVRPYKGLEVISAPTSATFLNVKENDGPQLTVTVRLTDPKQGTLAVFFKAQRGTRRDGGSVGITYGTEQMQ